MSCKFTNIRWLILILLKKRIHLCDKIRRPVKLYFDNTLFELIAGKSTKKDVMKSSNKSSEKKKANG